VERVRFGNQDAAQAGPLKWDTCGTVLEALRDLDAARCDGIIELTSFNCGCDSVAGTLFREAARSQRIPLMVLVLDEHTAQAGLDTRLEAFVDSIGGRS